MKQLSRRKFLAASGAAATGAAVAAAPGLVRSASGTQAATPGDPAAKVVEPSQPAPPEPVMAYVRDHATGEVTVMAGTQEMTYRDPALVKRLLDAAPAHDELASGGEANVLTP